MEESSCAGVNAQEKRPKSILKHAHASEKPEVKWDEMNILETYHPANKDYGHMKINEPPTPYSNLEDSDDDQDTTESSVDPKELSESLSKASERKHAHSEEEGTEESDLTEDAKAEKRAFKDKRSKHYDEFSNVQKARELIAKELADLENEGEEEHQQMDTTDT